MMKKTFIVLFSVGKSFDARPLAESIENNHYEFNNESKCETISASRIKDLITKELEIEEHDKQHIVVFPITDFMDEFNNQQIDDDSYFMSYVTGTIKKI